MNATGLLLDMAGGVSCLVLTARGKSKGLFFKNVPYVAKSPVAQLAPPNVSNRDA